MKKTVLRQVLEFVETTPGMITPGQIAKELNLTPGQVENMLEFWVRKDRLQAVDPGADCGGCGSSAACPLLADMPRTYRVKGDFEMERNPNFLSCA
jgi:hypothetical protein